MLFKQPWRNTRRSVFIAFFLSYLFILSFPILVSGFFYSKVEQIMIEDAVRSNETLLEQVKQMLDSRVQELEKLTLQIGLNPKLQWLLNNQINEQSGEDLYRFIEVANGLSQYENINNFITSFYIYIAKTDTILAPRVKTDSKMFYEYIYRYKDLPYNDYLNWLSEYQFKSFRPSERILGSGNKANKNMITFVQSLPLGNKLDIQGALVVLIDESQIRDMLTKISGVNQGAAVYIFNERKEVVMSTGEEASSNLSFQEDSNLIISSATSSQNGWNYVSVVPKKIVLANVNLVKNWALILFIICLIVGWFVSYYLAYKNYRPIRDIINSILYKKNVPSDQAYNEIDLIKETIDSSFEEETRLKQSLLLQRPVIAADFLSRLIKGFLDVSTISNKDLDFMGIRFSHNYFCVIAVNIDDCTEFILNNTEREWALTRFILLNVSNDLLQGNGYTLELSRDQIVIVVNLPESSINDIEVFALQMKEIVENKFRTLITLSISSIYQGIDKINLCYQEALLAMDHKVIQGQSSIIYYKDIKDLEHQYYNYPIEMEVQLMNYTKGGDFSNAARLLDQIYDMNMKSHEITPEMGKFLFVDLLSTLLKISNSLNLSKEDVFEAGADPIRTILECSSTGEMHKIIKGHFRIICNKIKEDRTDHSEQLFASIIGYVEKHYSNNALSLNSIAEAFDLNPSYVSFFFKKHCGQNLSEYMAQLRINRSKELLANSTLTIYEIAIQVGYSNDVGFIRLFKKIEGITPGKYREALKEREQLTPK
jgi:two-component system response regulator YesN